MVSATRIASQIPPEFQGEALRRIETLRALVLEGERLALHEARICGPRLRAAAWWRRISLAMLVLGLLAFLQDFFIEADALAYCALLVGLGGHLIAEQRQDELLSLRDRLFENEKQALRARWEHLGITEPAITGIAAYVPEARSAYGWPGGDRTLQAFIDQAEACLVEGRRSSASSQTTLGSARRAIVASRQDSQVHVAGESSRSRSGRSKNRFSSP